MQVECGQLLAGKGAGGAAESLVPPVVVPQVSRQPLPIPQIRETVAAAGLRVGGVQLQVGGRGQVRGPALHCASPTTHIMALSALSGGPDVLPHSGTLFR